MTWKEAGCGAGGTGPGAKGGRRMQGRLILPILGAIGLLTACAGSPARPPALAQNPAVIQARLLGATLVPNVSAAQFVSRSDGWLAIDAALSPYQSPSPVPGEILRTTDGGRTWHHVAWTAMPVLALDFRSPDQGFVLEGQLVGTAPTLTLLAASDAGRNLREISQPPGDPAACRLSFSSETQGLVVCQDTLDVTVDGGRTWSASQTALPPQASRNGESYYATDFLTAKLGFAAQGEGILRTTDGGRSWRYVYTLPGGQQGFGPVTFASAEVGYAAFTLFGPDGAMWPDVVLRTVDGGSSWQAIASSTAIPGLEVPQSAPDAFGDAIAAWGEEDVAMTTMQGVAVSGDAGRTWRFAGSMVSLQAALAPAPGRGVFAAVGGQVIDVLSDGSWRVSWPTDVPFGQVDFLGARQGLGLAVQPGTQATLVRTADGGGSWASVPLPAEIRNPAQISFADRRHGWAINASRRQVFATSDSGRTWWSIYIGQPISAQALGHGRGVLVAQPRDYTRPRVLLVTADGGRHFDMRRLPAYFPLGGSVTFSSPQVGFAVATGEIWRSGDGGRHWRLLNLPSRLDDASGILASSADRHGDIWLLATFPGANLQGPESVFVRSSSGVWREIRLPGQYSRASETVDAVSRLRAWLVTPAGVFQTTDGGRIWRNRTWPSPL